MEQEYLILGPGVRQRRRYCSHCQSPLPFEPDLIRRVISRTGGPEAVWMVRHCRNPICQATDMQAGDDLSDIERLIDGSWQ
jgi:hypothetical protein